MKRILLTLLIAAVLCISATGIAEQDSMWFDKTVNTVFEGETLQLVLKRHLMLAAEAAAPVVDATDLDYYLTERSETSAF